MLKRESYAKMSPVRLFQVGETSGSALVSAHGVLEYVLGKFIVEHAVKYSSVSGATR